MNMKFYWQSLYQEVIGATVDFLPDFISGIIIFLVFVFLYFLLGKLFDRVLAKQDEQRKNAVLFLRKMSRSLVLIVGLITTLGTWGINITALVVGLGLAGFALGLALKDALASILAGGLIIIYRPFNVKDKINVCGVDGEIVSVDLRYTTLKSGGKTHLIPNSKLLSEKVTILS